MRVISLFDRSGVMVEPFAIAGCDVLTIDIEPARHHYPSIQSDIKDVEPQRADILFAFPPCTHLSRAGARFWSKKEVQNPDIFKDAFALCEIAKRWCINARYWMIENPIGKINQFWRYPDWFFNPYEFAGYLPVETQKEEAYTKHTCIWSNFKKPPVKPINPIYTNFANLPFNKYQRSLTPTGFATAVAKHLLSGAEFQPPLFRGMVL